MIETVQLYRPTGTKELAPIEAGGLTAFPAEDPEEFNQNIVGRIEVTAEFRG